MINCQQNYEVLKLDTWIDEFDSKEININEIQKYLEFIKESAKNYDPERYSEWHHVMPRCVDKDHKYDDEGVRVNGRDHFLAHKMLVECFNGKKKSKMSFALHRMYNSGINYETTPEEYELQKFLWNEAMNPRKSEAWFREKVSKGHLGQTSPMKGKSHTEETKQKISKAVWQYYAKGNHPSTYGKHLSEEHRRKIGESGKGKHSDISGEKNPFYGHRHTEETKRILSEKHTGFHHSEETRRKMSESHKRQSRKPLSEEQKSAITQSRRNFYKDQIIKGYLDVKSTYGEVTKESWEKVRNQRLTEYKKQHPGKSLRGRSSTIFLKYSTIFEYYKTIDELAETIGRDYHA